MADWAEKKAAELAPDHYVFGTLCDLSQIRAHIARALRAARAEGIEAAWQATYAAMANETNASQQRVRKAIRALLTKESEGA